MSTGGASAQSWRRHDSQVLTSHPLKGSHDVTIVPERTYVRSYVSSDLSVSLSACRGCQSILSILGMEKVRMTFTYMPCSSCSSPARTAQWLPPSTFQLHTPV